MSFGYSVGDVIAGANLTCRLIKIMADTKGGSVEFLEAMAELSAMQQAFFQVSNIRSHEMLPPATVNAASHIVLSSMDIIAKFLERSKHYQRILGDSRASTFESSWCKIGWTLYKSHELRDLRDALHAKLACTPMAQHQVDDENVASSSPELELEPLRFKDAVGRKFSLPWHLCNTWQGMEGLIKQAFHDVEVLGPHVEDGHYDLIGPDGEIILPSVWDRVVQPGMMVTMNMWPMDKPSPPMPPRHMPTNIPGFGPPLPAGWEIKSDVIGRTYLVDHNTGTTHGNPPDDLVFRTPTASPIPSAPQSTAPSEAPITQREAETGTNPNESHHSRGHSSDARDSPELTPNEILRAKEELARRIKELDIITQPAVIKIVNDMTESSRITRAQSKTIRKALKTMSLDSFKDAISAFQTQMSCSEGNLSRDSSLRNTEGQTSFGDVVGNDKEYERDIEEDSGISVDGQDHESIAPASDSEDWEDYTDDEEASAGDKDSGC
ncbi:hypothetical protein CEP53_001896 [Fusarium sp. AF-6]|nr:hypothetical protein CEP53_001896 [Fusarium sp. AF-6]